MTTPLLPYVPPQPAFRRCRCGALVLREHGVVVSPLLGIKHVCAKRKEQAA
jgi:hypothetical protein